MPSLPAWFDPQATGGHRVARLRKSRRRANLKRGGDAARSKHAHGALMMIVKGAQGMIVKHKLPYAIKKERDGAGDITLGLHPAARR